MKEKKLLVTIDCLAYNHENYIAEAIEGFLMQKTSFDYEILIHDDASTDRTVEIIKDYEKRYPELIKVVYQTVNQYSKGVKVDLINHNRAEGKYIALCEGDDYWTDPYKLQKQVDFMEANPECSMCVHAAHRVSAVTGEIVMSDRPSQEDRLFTTAEIIQGGGDLFATSSIMYSREKIVEFPDFYLNAVVGDYPHVIYASLVGSVYYMDDNMSVYRVDVNGSWTTREFSTVNKRIEHYERIAEMLDEVNHYTNFEYDSVISRTNRRHRFELLMDQGRFDAAKTEEYREFYTELGLKRRMSAKFRYFFPKSSGFLNFVKLRTTRLLPSKNS